MVDAIRQIKNDIIIKRFCARYRYREQCKIHSRNLLLQKQMQPCIIQHNTYFTLARYIFWNTINPFNSEFHKPGDTMTYYIFTKRLRTTHESPTCAMKILSLPRNIAVAVEPDSSSSCVVSSLPKMKDHTKLQCHDLRTLYGGLFSLVIN